MSEVYWELEDSAPGNGAATNLKVGGTRPSQSVGNFFVVPLHFFGSTSTISYFVERFRDGQ